MEMGGSDIVFDSLRNPAAVSSLIFARIVYAINWLNIGAVFVLMSPDLGVGLAGLGALTSAFYLGIGLMQVPGGLLAARWGAKKVVVTGVLLSSFSVLGTSVLSDVSQIAVLRFLVGTGMAFVFAPGVVLVAALFRGGKFGVGVGLFNSAFDLGGLLGLFGWIVIASATGWRPSLALSGGLGVATGVLVHLYVPSGENRRDFGVSWGVLLSIIKDRSLVLLGLGTLGFGVSNLIISVFMIEYLVKSLSVSPPVAGLIASMVLVVPIFTAVWGGRIYDRTARPRRLMAMSLVGGSLALGISAFPNAYAALACAVLGGVVSGIGFTIAFAGARDLNRAGEKYDGLAIAWVNSISLTGAFIPPLFYSFVAGLWGYSAAWLGSALLSVIFVVPLVFLGEWSGR